MLQVCDGRGVGLKKKDHPNPSRNPDAEEDIHLEQNWEDIQNFLIGEIRLRERECYSVTFVEWRAYNKAYEEKLLQDWRIARFIAWQNHLHSNIKASAKKNTAEAFWPLKGDKKAVAVPPMNQKLNEGEEMELFRIIGKIGRS